ncbi:MAG: PorP/SprF family type IX secretion system membrane protein [Muribaculaceae bacterium]|nr:PorP/SprF family type IX secretion system membrane protein [Muribaculaceae bacterium]
MLKLKKNIYSLTLWMVALMAAIPQMANAQIDAQLTQYWALPSYYNPSSIGNVDFIHITAGSKLQWLGIKHAPMDFFAMADMPFKFLGKRWATGIILQQENVGLFSSQTVAAQLAWKKKMLGGTLSLGFQVGLLNQTFKGDSIFMPENDDAHTSVDDAIPKGVVTGRALDMAAGFSFTHKWFWVAASATHVTSPTINMKAGENEEDLYQFNTGRFFYLMAGSNIPIKNTLFEIQPSVLVKTDTKFWQGEATLRVRYNKFLSGGVAYRHKDAVSAMIGAEFKNFFVGYAYDYPISSINKATHGSHELILNYNVKLNMGEVNKNKHKSIRIM